MPPVVQDHPPEPRPHPHATSGWPGDPQIEAHHGRNLALLAIHQVVLRVGWIFKTESVMMPAFVDWMAGPGAGFLRGWLPMLNRFGQSIPPVFCAERLKTMPQKKRSLAAFALLMSLPFGLLAAVCLAFDERQLACMSALFLVSYGAFFIFNGLYHLSFGTVQGKLIHPQRRGRLLLISTFYGSLPAMLLAWWLLPGWLLPGAPAFGYIFGFTAVCFFFSGLFALLLSEPPDPHQRPAVPDGGNLADTWRALRGDANLRLLVLVAMLFGGSLIVFPHYQAMARELLDLSGPHLMVWVIVQNAAVGIFSLFVGPLADAWGNRLTLRTLVFGSAVAPLFAALLPHLPGDWGASLFWMVFIPLGITPLVLRILVNYTLETCEPAEHPRYLSTVSLCLAAPFLFSPAVGWLVDAVGFERVFLVATGLVLLGACLTFHLDEPRHRIPHGKAGPVIAGGEE